MKKKINFCTGKKKNKAMPITVVICSLILLTTFSISNISAEDWGYNYLESSPTINYSLIPTVNNSNFWNGLDTPADIDTGDLNDDGTYVKVAGDTMTGDLTIGDIALFVDENLKRTGIGTATPYSTFHVVGDTRLGGELFVDDDENSVGIWSTTPRADSLEIYGFGKTLLLNGTGSNSPILEMYGAEGHFKMYTADNSVYFEEQDGSLSNGFRFDVPVYMPDATDGMGIGVIPNSSQGIFHINAFNPEAIRIQSTGGTTTGSMTFWNSTSENVWMGRYGDEFRFDSNVPDYYSFHFMDAVEVDGNITASDFVTKSMFYKGDALSLISDIKEEPTLSNNQFVKINHSTLGDVAVSYNNSYCVDDEKKECYVDSFEGQSVDKSIALLLRANQQLLERIEELEDRVYVLEHPVIPKP